VKVIVGGAPVTGDFAVEIGADGWAPDAASAKDLALELAGKK
jgi:5-methyltetrahydrofolate--homocysteine methyltransferase